MNLGQKSFSFHAKRVLSLSGTLFSVYFSNKMSHWFQSTQPILALSPMAGYTDSAFRILVKELEPRTIVFSEFVSADGIKFHAKKTLEMLQFDPIEQPLVIQIFGKKPAFFAEAAKVIESIGAAGIDINMGCPARKVVNSGHGSDLIRNQKLATEIVSETVKAVSLPITVKTRLGHEDSSALIPFCKTLVEAGAQALTIHGRTVKQGYSGTSCWDEIYRLKEEISVPVLGNGDITSGEEAVKQRKNLDGIMVGRATFGNPWVMKEIAAALYNEPKPITPSWEERKTLAIRHSKLLIKTKGEKKGMLEIRKHLAAYIKGINGAKELRSKLVRVESIEEVINIFKTVPPSLS